MPLRSYQEVRPWARGIRDKVVTGEMPPWFANPLHGSFKNNPTLSEEEISTITEWVDAGAPQGDPAADRPASAKERRGHVAKNIMWDGETYSFDMQMRLGPIGGDFVVSGHVDNGTISGDFEGSGMVPFSSFEGMLAEAGE